MDSEDIKAMLNEVRESMGYDWGTFDSIPISRAWDWIPYTEILENLGPDATIGDLYDRL